MPIYEYKCDKCETRFEKLVRRTADENQLSCPSCGERHLSQEYSTFSARANGLAAQQAPACPGGMCRTPGMCGMN
jgi:putative FmdB family regulatory protein